MRPDTREIAPLRTDLDLFLGWGKYFPNPDEILQRRSSGRGIKFYDEIARDPHAYAVLQTRRLAVTGLEHEVQPASDDARDQEVAEFIREELGECGFRDATLAFLDALLKGYAVVEILWQRRPDGRVGIGALKPRGQHRFVFDPDGNPRLLTQANMVEGEELPGRKFLVGSWGATDGNPYGQGLGRLLYWPVWFKKNALKFWLIFCEKFGMPTVVGKYPPGASPEQQTALLDAIKAVQVETGIKIPDTMAIELLEAQRTGSVDSYEKLLSLLNAEISKIVLGQTLTTEIGDKGSYAASQTHSEVRQDYLEADARFVEGPWQQLIDWLCEINFGELPNGTPWVRLRSEPPRDLIGEVGRDVQIFKTLGLPVAKSFLYDKYDVPPPEDGDELLVVPQGIPALPDAEFAEAEKKTPSSAIWSRGSGGLTRW